MERETLKRAIAGGVVTVALGCGGLWYFGSAGEAPAAPLRTKVVKVTESPKPVPTVTKVAATTTAGRREPRKPMPEPTSIKQPRERNRTRPEAKKKIIHGC